METEARIWSRLDRKGIACLLVSNRRAVLERADRVLLLDRGRIVDRGTLDALRARSELMRRLLSGS